MSLLLEAINDRGKLPPITSCYGDVLDIMQTSSTHLEMIKNDSTLDAHEELYRVRDIVKVTITALAHWSKLSDYDIRIK